MYLYQSNLFKEMALICWLAQLIPDLPPHLPPSQLKEEVRQAKSTATGLRAQMEETEQKALLLERQLKEQGAKCRELEDQRTLTQSQEQRVAQSHREAQQSQAELASLEAILALLHLREVESNIYTQSHCCLCSHVTFLLSLSQCLT